MAVGASGGRDGESIRAPIDGFGGCLLRRAGVTVLVGDHAECAFEAPEQRHSECGASDNVAAGDVTCAGQDLVWMFGGVGVDACGVGFDDGAKLGRQIAFVARVDVVLDAKQVPEKIRLSAFFAEVSAKPAASEQDCYLNGGEIILGVRERHAVSDFRVISPVDRGNAVCVARYGGLKIARWRRGRRWPAAGHEQSEQTCRKTPKSHRRVPTLAGWIDQLAAERKKALQTRDALR